MSLVLAYLNADKWPCGCWQLDGHPLLHLCNEHQNSVKDDSEYWRTTPTKPMKVKILEVQP